MNFEPALWNVITVGAWNQAILTPEWIAKSIFNIAPDTPVPLEVPLNIKAPWKVKLDGCEALVTENALEFIASDSTYSTLDKARIHSMTAMDALPKTPFGGAGFNIRYSSEDEPDTALARLTQCDLDSKLADCGLNITSGGTKRTLEFEGGELNLTVSSIDSNQTNIDFNFHKGSTDEEELKQWLTLSMDLIEKQVALTMKTIGATT